jgi:hypothetical protein
MGCAHQPLCSEPPKIPKEELLHLALEQLGAELGWGDLLQSRPIFGGWQLYFFLGWAFLLTLVFGWEQEGPLRVG